MKAVVLAAGRGTRLGKLTDNCPKPMVEVEGMPIVEYVMSGIIEAGIKDFVLVTKYLSEKVKEYFGDGSKWGINVQYVDQDDRYGTGVALLMSKELVGDDDILMCYGDCLMEKKAYKEAVELFDRNDVFAVEALNYVDDPWQGSAVMYDENNIITEMIEKPEKGTIPSHWNSAGLFVFKNDIYKYCEALEPSPRGEYELPEAINRIISDGKKIYAYTLDGDWCDMGRPEDIPFAAELIRRNK